MFNVSYFISKIVINHIMLEEILYFIIYSMSKWNVLIVSLFSSLDMFKIIFIE
jgi:hypothetical protein